LGFEVVYFGQKRKFYLQKKKKKTNKRRENIQREEKDVEAKTKIKVQLKKTNKLQHTPQVK
jgi:hypothetical protein